MTLLGRFAEWQRLRIIRTVITRSMTILDLGCGSGTLVDRLRREGFNVIGVDLNLPDSKVGVHLLRRNAYSTGFDDNSFDCVVCIETIEHLEPRVYDEICRITRDGGILILTTPKKRWDPLIRFLSSLGLTDEFVTPHINLVEPKDLPFILESSGSLLALEWYGVYRILKGRKH